MGQFKVLIYEVQNGNRDKFLEIVERMEPSIKKYMRVLFKDELEDVHSELVLSLWEAVTRIKYANADGQIIMYLCRALNIKFLELYRKSINRHNNEICLEDMSLLEICYIENPYQDVLTRQDIINILKRFRGVKRKITYYMALELLTDSQISVKLHISKQYVNRVRKELRGILKELYFND